MSTNPTPPNPSQGSNLGGRLEELRVGVDWLMKETYRQREELRLVREQSEVAQNQQVQATVELRQTTRELRRTVDELHQQNKVVPPPVPSQAAQSTQNPPTRVTIAIVALAAMLLVILIVSALLGFRGSTSWFAGSIAAFILLVILLAYWLKWEWTGLPEQKGPPGSKDIFYQGPKTAWDWLLLFAALAIPLVIAFGTLWFTTQQSQTSDMASMNQRAVDMQLAKDQQQEMALETYLDRMSDLLLNSNVRANNQIGKDIRNLARARTLTALPRLDSERKAVVLKFLYFTNLINRYDQFPVVNLDGADLSGADLKGFSLIGADLARVNLSGANLSGADLTNAYLPQANLSGADLEKAILRSAKLSEADLSGAKLNQATLSGADFSPDKSLNLNAARLTGANLREARLNSDLQLNLPGTNLSGVDLSRADLTGANLQGATVTNEQLAKASSLKCAILPNGIKNPC